MQKVSLFIPCFVDQLTPEILNMEAGPLGHPGAIALIEKGVYRITERGTAILKSNPVELTIKDL